MFDSNHDIDLFASFFLETEIEESRMVRSPGAEFEKKGNE